MPYVNWYPTDSFSNFALRLLQTNKQKKQQQSNRAKVESKQRSESYPGTQQ